MSRRVLRYASSAISARPRTTATCAAPKTPMTPANQGTPVTPANQGTPVTPAAMVYPPARRAASEPLDPYRWLEDPDAPETAAFVDAQNQRFGAHLAAGFPHLGSLHARISALADYPRTGVPMRQDSHAPGSNESNGPKPAYFLFANSGLQPQSVLYRTATLDGPRSLFLDPNSLSSDGTVSIQTYAFSESGRFFAYALSASGSDWVSIHVRETPNDSDAVINKINTNIESSPLEWAKFTSIAWTHDDAGFFYTRFPAPDNLAADKRGTETHASRNAMLCFHRLGSPQSDDVLVHDDPDHPDFLHNAEVSTDGKFVVRVVSDGCKPENQLFVARLPQVISANSVPKFVPIADAFDAAYDYITNIGPVFFLKTSLGAPKKRIVKFDIDNPAAGFVEVVPESDAVIASVHLIHNSRIVVTYLRDVKHVASVFDLVSGAPVAPFTLPMPEGSIITSMSGRPHDAELFYAVSSYLSPGTIYRYDFAAMSHSVFNQTVVKGFHPDNLQTKQIFYESKDGTRIPMYLISRKDINLDGSNPTILYGYGGFNISIKPSFSIQFAAWVQYFGGVVAVANIRGGGEYGKELWYDQGRLKNKQNVFDDFQAAARWLSANGYARPDKIAINGGSNGGLLVGACVNQAPELFGAAVAEVGVLDMYRFHKFTIGSAWVSDYGNPDVQEDFEVLRKYSPLHNIQADKEYPSVLIMTGDHDDRVVPLHSHKFIATLQHLRKDNIKPLLERVETKAGHGAGKSTQQRINEMTDKLAFISIALGAKYRE